MCSAPLLYTGVREPGTLLMTNCDLPSMAANPVRKVPVDWHFEQALPQVGGEVSAGLRRLDDALAAHDY